MWEHTAKEVSGDQAGMENVNLLNTSETKFGETSTPTLWDIYEFSYYLALRSWKTHQFRKIAALILEPCNYWRNVEVPEVLRLLSVKAGEKVLDIGSPKLPSLFAWYRLGADMYATDLFPYFFDEYANHVESLGGSPYGGKYQMEVQDARLLTYPDEYFDKIYSISVLEHIEGQGDTPAIREIARVLKPGGVCCITVPFSARYYESTIDYELYYKKPVHGKPVFFERHYDPDSLRSRILEPSGLVIKEIRYFGERWVPYERIGNSLPRLLKVALLPLGPLCSALFLHRLREDSHLKAKAVLILLQKSSQDGRSFGG